MNEELKQKLTKLGLVVQEESLTNLELVDVVTERPRVDVGH